MAMTSDISYRSIPMIPYQASRNSGHIPQRQRRDGIDIIGRQWCGYECHGYRPAAKPGLDLSGPKIQSYGVSGPVESVISHVDPEIGKGHEHYSFRVPVRILFSNTDYYAPTLLGRKGFFEKFKITIDESVQKVVLRAVED